jgi:tRNA G18 (ribose-2'-O)-methylase SpoU
MSADVHVIDDIEEPVAARLKTLISRSGSRHTSEIVIEDEVNVLGARDANVEILGLFVSQKHAQTALISKLSPDVETSVVSDDVLAQLFERTRTPDVFATARLPAPATFRTLTASGPGDIVVLDSVDGPGNIGAVIRGATAFEAAGVVALNRDRPAVYRRGVVRASAGNMFKVPIVTATTNRFARFCAASGTLAVALSSHADTTIDDVVARPERLALIFGSETRGCSPEVLEIADVTCRIPIAPGVESLNVSAAANIMMFLRSPLRRR